MRRRMMGFLIMVGAFGAGLATGALRSSPVAPQSAIAPPGVVDVQQQLVMLQQRLQEREAELSALRQRLRTPPEPRRPVKQQGVLDFTAAEEASESMLAPGSEEVPLAEVSLTAEATQSPEPATEQDVLSRLYQYLDDSDGRNSRQRRAQMRALINDLRAMGEVAVTALLEVLESGDNSRERRTAAALLGSLQDARALPVLQEVLEREDDLMLRRAAARGLRQLQLPEALPVLAQTLANRQDDRFVRLSAAYGLAQMGETQGTVGLMQIFQEAEDDGQGRGPALRALMALNDPTALPLMRQLVVADTEVSYRLAAIRFLARQGDQEALPLLQQLLASPREQPSVVDAAIQAHDTIRSAQRPAQSR